MPGLSLPRGFASSMRARTVRVAAFTSGRIALTRPRRRLAGIAPARAPRRALPGASERRPALRAPRPLTHTVASPAMRNSVAPAATVMPSRTPSSAITPETGARSVTRGCDLPFASPARRSAPRSCRGACSRWRAAAREVARSRVRRGCAAAGTPPARPPSPGTGSRRAARPARTGSSGARTCSFSTKPPARGCTSTTARSLYSTLPTASSFSASDPRRRLGGAHAEVLRDARTDRHACPRRPPRRRTSGTSCMSMKGDLPGLSNAAAGTSGRTSRELAGRSRVRRWSASGTASCAALRLAVPIACSRSGNGGCEQRAVRRTDFLMASPRGVPGNSAAPRRARARAAAASRLRRVSVSARRASSTAASSPRPPR